jgi:hypothetical protein
MNAASTLEDVARVRGLSNKSRRLFMQKISGPMRRDGNDVQAREKDEDAHDARSV